MVSLQSAKKTDFLCRGIGRKYRPELICIQEVIRWRLQKGEVFESPLNKGGLGAGF